MSITETSVSRPGASVPIARRLGRNALLDGDDAVAGDRHIGDAVARGRRIDHPSAAQQQVDFQIGFVGVHRLILCNVVTIAPGAAGRQGMPVGLAPCLTRMSNAAWRRRRAIPWQEAE
jgi:hypothetical protein